MSDNLDQFVPRMTAAHLLDISVRTLDRAANDGRIQKYKRGGRVYFSLSEVQEMVHQPSQSSLSTLSTSVSVSAAGLDSTLSNLSSARSSADLPPSNSSSDNLLPQIQKDFKDLLEKQEEFQREIIQKIQKDLDESQKRLEAANYRVGQLETELHNSVPLLESVEKTEQIFELGMKIDNLSRALRDEKFSKILYWLLAIVTTGITVFTLLFW